MSNENKVVLPEPVGEVGSGFGTVLGGHGANLPNLPEVGDQCWNQALHGAANARDAERYRWLVGARTKEQAECVSGTVCNPLPQDNVLSEMQCFYLHKEQADSLIDAAIAAAKGE